VTDCETHPQHPDDEARPSAGTVLAQSYGADRPRPASADPLQALVPRTHEAGLRAARSARVELIGLVPTADAPRKLPRQLHDLARLVADRVPRTWEIDWLKELPCGEPTRSLSARCRRAQR
jgi:hypothetical protein